MAGPFTSGHKVLNTDVNPMLLGWIDFVWFGLTLAYVSADAPTFVFSVNADVTTVVEPGMRVKLTQTTDKFFIVTAVGAYAAGVTPVTVYGGTDYTLANAAISAGAFSTHKKPFGFNANPAKWTVSIKDASSRAQGSPVAGTWYNPGAGALSLTVPIGSWYLRYEAYFSVSGASSDMSIIGTLSTANNSESDSELSSQADAGTNAINATMSRNKIVLLAAKTAYYLNIKTGLAAAGSIAVTGNAVPTILCARCAYL